MVWRSAEWFAGRDELGPQSRSVLRSLGWTPEFFTGKPVIGIANSWSELNNCHLGFKLMAEAVKRGVIAAGGVPLEFNTISLGEELMKPSAMLYRNLLAMEIEETLRAYPLDGVVLLTGCDKTTPAQLMGVASANLPAIQVCAGPKRAGRWRGQELGSGTDLWHYLDEYRTGKINKQDWHAIEEMYSSGMGTCNTMGTASTMTVLSEALGMMLPGTATIPATNAQRLAAAELSGRRAVELVQKDLRPAQIMTREAFENALRVFMAIAGSTNAVIHLIAIAGRLRVPLTLADFDDFARTTPILLNLQPSGEKLMADFDAAGGTLALLQELRDLLHLECLTVTGEPLGESLKVSTYADPTVIYPRDKPLAPAGALAVLRGNLAPHGAILRTTTASAHLHKHCGPALVFDTYEDMLARIDDPALPVTADSVLVLRNAGAVGVPGLPEWGSIPIPKKLLLQGIKDVVRISDSRMSGTSSGTIILHVAPEAAVGGPLAFVKDGDLIELDVEERQLIWHIAEHELAKRQAQWQPPRSRHGRGYPRLYAEHVLQPDQGCDFDFLRPATQADLTFVPPTVGRS
ncbi:dihydroxy-acid dehydratase [Ktedonosporobacter rubrisoli]|uniref:Dihydroxy-acid dehydratase n=1 Tax=Ktedonosporobacter rubrisoli TaxID=2509675 RepID=A0A4P6JP04_KTERU|nr:dihydroxy-acid dehydratase [Ktedonosporobacter rubrisoli]QBD76476.1 dihydroxy-acid dehydratase [Ktedonosporobacter rubrisoli]